MPLKRTIHDKDGKLIAYISPTVKYEFEYAYTGDVALRLYDHDGSFSTVWFVGPFTVNES